MARKTKKTDWPLFEQVGEIDRPTVWPELLQQMADTAPVRGSSLIECQHAEQVMRGIHGEGCFDENGADVPASDWINFALIAGDEQSIARALSAVSTESAALEARARASTAEYLTQKSMDPQVYFNSEVKASYEKLRRSMCRFFGRTNRAVVANSLADLYISSDQEYALHCATVASMIGGRENPAVSMDATIFSPDASMIGLCVDLLMGRYVTNPKRLSAPVGIYVRRFSDQMKYTDATSVASAFGLLFEGSHLSMAGFDDLYAETSCKKAKNNFHNIGSSALNHALAG